MKKRIQLDSAILSITIVGTAALFAFSRIYLSNAFWDNVLDFFGIMFILDGQLLRMTARGHKKNFSQRSRELVTSGPYGLVRNPMYLGSFLIGMGFVLMVWPWWSLPLFAGIFWMRFRRQMNKEERILTKKFGEDYTAYARQVPRFFPNLLKFKELVDFKIALKKAFDWHEALATKERRTLGLWLPLAFVLDLFQEWVVYGQADLVLNVQIFLVSGIVYCVVCMILVKKPRTA